MRNEIKIIRIVSDFYGVDLLDEENLKTRKRSVVVPRQIAMHLIYDFTPLSFDTVGKLFNKNHATVMHAHKLISDLTHYDLELKQELYDLKILVKSEVYVAKKPKDLLIDDIVAELHKMNTESVTKIAKIIIAETPN